MKINYIKLLLLLIIPTLSFGFINEKENNKLSNSVEEQSCELKLGRIVNSCDQSTTGVDTYTVLIPFSGGKTSEYTINTNGIGKIEGDNPNTVESGTLKITNVPEGTNFTINFNSSTCNFIENINSPSCIPSSSVTCGKPGDVIFSEIMQNPRNIGDGDGEYFELYNTTSSEINLIGWTISDESTAGEQFRIDTNLIIPANGYIVFGRNANTALNGGIEVNFVYADILLGNSTDGLILSCSSSIIDKVIWDNGATFPDPNGKSMELAIEKLNANDNDNGANWKEASKVLSSGDFGTPGVKNSATLSIGKIEIEGFEIYPNPIKDVLKIKTRANSTKKVAIYTLLGEEILKTNITNKTINLSKIPSGVYILKVTENGKTATQKIIIE